MLSLLQNSRPTYYCLPKPPLDGTTTANGSPEFHTNEYDLYNMPMRNHGRHVLEARCVEELGPDSELGMTTGINGLPLILRLTTFQTHDLFHNLIVHLKVNYPPSP